MGVSLYWPLSMLCDFASMSVSYQIRVPAKKHPFTQSPIQSKKQENKKTVGVKSRGKRGGSKILKKGVDNIGAGGLHKIGEGTLCQVWVVSKKTDPSPGFL